MSIAVAPEDVFVNILNMDIIFTKFFLMFFAWSFCNHKQVNNFYFDTKTNKRLIKMKYGLHESKVVWKRGSSMGTSHDLEIRIAW